MSSIREIESVDVLRLIAQFLSEHNLPRTLASLVSESGLPTLTDVASLDAVAADCRAGRWDAVLSATTHAPLDVATRTQLYEQVFFELVEASDAEAAVALLRHAPPLAALRSADPERHARLAHILDAFDPVLAYGGKGNDDAKLKRRKALAKALCRQLRQAPPPGRLLAIIAQALQWQQFRGLLPPAGQPYDLFADAAAPLPPTASAGVTAADKNAEKAKKKSGTAVASDLANAIKFSKSATPMCAAFAPDGASLATGSSDGFVELWQPHSGKLRRDLAYQANDDILMHDCAVLCVAFSLDSLLLASGDANGQLKVWHVPTGKIVRRFERAHQQAVLSVEFLRDGTRVVTCSQDETVCVHGLQSGTTLKVLRGHTSFVNDLALLRDAQMVVSAGSDGTVRVWDLRTSACTQQFALRADGDERGIVAPVASVCVIPDTDDHLLLCNRTDALYVTTLGGRVLRTLTSESAHDERFVACSTGALDNKYVYGVTDQGNLYSFELASGKLQRKVSAHEAECLGIALHPHDVLVATLARNDRKLKLWE